MRLRDPRGQDLVDAHHPHARGLPRPARRRAATCSARPSRSAAGTPRRPPARRYELIRDIAEVVPGVLELEIEELGAGLRPGTPDNLPVIGAARAASSGRPGTTATGSCSPTSPPRLVARVLAGEGLPEWAAPCDPRALRGGRRVKVLVNGEPTRARDAARRCRPCSRRSSCPARPRRRGRGRRRGRAARRVARARAERGRAGRGPARDPGRLKWRSPTTRTRSRSAAAS